MNKILYAAILLLFFSCSAQAEVRIDSVGLVNIKGNIYILHKVDKGQGLYAVSRRYGVSLVDLKSANGDSLSSLKLGQVIFVPYQKVVKEERITKHKVNKGETLYKISKQYNVSINNLIEWNKLGGTGIKEGDELIIKQMISKKVPASSVVETTDHSEINTGNQDTKDTNIKKENKVANSEMDTDYKSGTNEVEEEGIATWVSDPSFESRRSLALHKTAPVGTIIKVVNLINNQSAYVKVVGQLPASSKEIVKLSKFTAKQIGLKDKISRVKVYYYKAPEE